MNIAVLNDYKDNFVGVVGHDYNSQSVFYKVTNQFLDNLLEQLLQTKVYETKEDGDLELIEEVTKADKDYLETVLTKLELYKVKKFYEDITGNLKQNVQDKFKEEENA